VDCVQRATSRWLSSICSLKEPSLHDTAGDRGGAPFPRTPYPSAFGARPSNKEVIPPEATIVALAELSPNTTTKGGGTALTPAAPIDPEQLL
jgi:hypothetical protein